MKASSARLQTTVGQIPAGPAAPARSDQRLHGVWLALAHTAWILIVLLDAVIFVPGALLYSRTAHIPSTPLNAHDSAPGQLSPQGLRALAHLGLSLDTYAALALAFVLVPSVVFFALGAVIAQRKWSDGLGLLVSALLITFGANGSQGAFQAVDSQLLPSINPALADVQFWIGGYLFIAQWPAFGTFLLTFPTGRFTPRWSVLLVGLWITNFFAFDLGPPPVVTVVSVLVTFGSVLAVQIYRYRRVYGRVARLQTKWLVFALAVTVGFQVVTLTAQALFTGSGGSDPIVWAVVAPVAWDARGAVVFLLIAMAVTTALLRYRLYDIDIIIRRTLVYSALTGGVVGIYVLVVGYLGAAFRTGSNLLISLVATGLVAVLFQPLRGWLQHGVNRLLYGQRDDPYGVLARLDTRLALAIPAETVLPTIVETVATALKLPYAAITLAPREPTGSGPSPADRVPAADDLVPAAAHGKPPTGTSAASLTRLPLAYGPETVGHLLLAPRPGEGGFAPADRRLLDELAAHAGVVVHAVRLTSDLQHARERLVTAREEERRRLRRDLHDGLGPQLASLALTLGAAREYVSRDQAAADALLADLGTHVQSAIADVRRLIYALRPPALDDLGLVGALREQAARYTTGSLMVRVEADEALPGLPAAAEVAAYRIGLEALVNTVRHARASSCRIGLSAASQGRALVVEVVDDGMGLPEHPRAGVGLGSMRERAAELGGECTIGPAPDGGTRVVAVLPLAQPVTEG